MHLHEAEPLFDVAARHKTNPMSARTHHQYEQPSSSKPRETSLLHHAKKQRTSVARSPEVDADLILHVPACRLDERRVVRSASRLRCTVLGRVPRAALSKSSVCDMFQREPPGHEDGHACLLSGMRTAMHAF
jgi:hypothetical protein